MAETKIEWTHRPDPRDKSIMLPGFTFNPWIGCTGVSRACRFCYAEAQDERRFSRTLGGATAQNPIPHWGKGAPRYRTSPDNWKKPKQWNKLAQDLGVSLMVFTASLADVFDEEVEDAWRDDLFNLIYETPNLDWLVLTKRTAKMRDYLTGSAWWINSTPGNVWLGATMEDQKSFDSRIGDLLATPAVKHFASMEPLFEHVDIRAGLQIDSGINRCQCCDGEEHSSRLDWVIFGGESNGNHIRDQRKSHPTHPDHFSDLALQCWMANTPAYFKQWGDWAPAYDIQDPQARGVAAAGNVLMHDHGTGAEGRRYSFCVGKRMAGHLLDGQVVRETPSARIL